MYINCDSVWLRLFCLCVRANVLHVVTPCAMDKYINTYIYPIYTEYVLQYRWTECVKSLVDLKLGRHCVMLRLCCAMLCCCPLPDSALF